MSTWMVCFRLSVLFLFVAIFLIMMNRRSFKAVLTIATAGVILTAATMVFPYYSASEGTIAGLLDSLLVSFKIFIMNDSYSYVLKAAQTNLDGLSLHVYSILIALIYLIAPFLAATFILQYLSSIFSQMKVLLNNKKDLYLFSELNRKSLTLARSIKAKEYASKPLIVFTGLSKEKAAESSDLVRQVKEEHMLCINQKSEELKLKYTKSKSKYFFQISADEDENLISALSLIEKYKSEKNTNMRLYIHSSQNEAEVLLDATDKGCVVTKIINESQINAYHLLDKIPLYHANILKNNRISILLVGSGYYGMELLKAFVWCGQMQGIGLEINVIDAQAEKYRSELAFECPELMNGEYRIQFHTADVLNEEFRNILKNKCSDSNYICIALGEDELNIRTALYLRRHYLLEDPEFMDWPVITLLVRDNEKFKAVSQIQTNSKIARNFDLQPFGSTEELYNCDVLVNSCLDNLALNVYAAYDSIHNANIKKEEVIESYNKYEIYKRSNLANALHIKYKLWHLGYDFIKDENSGLPETELILSKDEKEGLVRLEHDRWNAFQRKEGWRRASTAQVEAYMKSGLNDKHRHFIGKLHPCICNFDELVPLCELYDPNFIRYDENYIEKISDILGDKWGITGEKYKIVKK